MFGAGGFIGSALATYLAENNEVLGVSRFSKRDTEADLNKCGVKTVRKDVLKDKIDDIPTNYDYVFSELAMTNNFDCEKNPNESFKVNSYFVGDLMEHFKEVSGIILGSTGSVYRPFRRGIDELSPLGPSTHAGTTYALSKFGGDLLGMYFSERNKTPSCILRYFRPYSLDRGFVTVLVKSVMGRKVIPFTKGFSNPIYISDVVELTVAASKHCSIPSKIINVGGKEVVSFGDLVHIVSEVVGEKPIFSTKEEEHELKDVWFCNTKLQQNLLGEPRVSLKEGIERIFEYLRREHD